MQYENKGRSRSGFRVLLVMGLVLCAGASQGQIVSKDECIGVFRADLPLTITRSGTYCLAESVGRLDLGSGAAITIAANNVVLDLNYNRLSNLRASSATQAVGILAVNQRNITIRNGTIRGFLFGIALRDAGRSSGHLVENVFAERNRQIGVLVQGAGNVIRNNRVLDTGGSTNLDPTIGGEGFEIGIVADGAEARLIDNDVATVTVGIAQQGGFASPNMPPSSNALFVNNRISDVFFGLIGGLDSAGEPTGKCRDNLFAGADNTFTQCIDAGNNN